LPASRQEEPSKRSEEGAIGCAGGRVWLLSTKHQRLMPEDKQLDVLGQLAAPASDEQPQQRGERKVNEGKEHPPMLPDHATTEGGT